MNSNKKLKEALGGAIRLIKSVDLALDDKKLSISEGLKITRASISFWGLVKNVAALKAEYKELDNEAKFDLFSYFEKEFDLKNDKAEEVIEYIFLALLEIGTAIKIMKIK